MARREACGSETELARRPAGESLRERHNARVVGFLDQRLIGGARGVSSARPQGRLSRDSGARSADDQDALE